MPFGKMPAWRMKSPAEPYPSEPPPPPTGDADIIVYCYLLEEPAEETDRGPRLRAWRHAIFNKVVTVHQYNDARRAIGARDFISFSVERPPKVGHRSTMSTLLPENEVPSDWLARSFNRARANFREGEIAADGLTKGWWELHWNEHGPMVRELLSAAKWDRERRKVFGELADFLRSLRTKT